MSSHIYTVTHEHYMDSQKVERQIKQAKIIDKDSKNSS